MISQQKITVTPLVTEKAFLHDISILIAHQGYFWQDSKITAWVCLLCLVFGVAPSHSQHKCTHQQITMICHCYIKKKKKSQVPNNIQTYIGSVWVLSSLLSSYYLYARTTTMVSIYTMERDITISRYFHYKIAPSYYMIKKDPLMSFESITIKTNLMKHLYHILTSVSVS